MSGESFEGGEPVAFMVDLSVGVQHRFGRALQVPSGSPASHQVMAFDASPHRTYLTLQISV